MCGIAGCLHFADDAPCRATLDAQLTMMHHRGPDARGTFLRPGAAVGQARLAILDVEKGDPPLTDESGSVCAVLNGEIYNHAHIASDLRRDGHELKSRCDTEVLAHLGEVADVDAWIRRLEGMFAFAILDASRRRLILGRDRMGKKPLYVWADESVVVFASEIKAVLAHPGVPRKLRAGVIPEYLTFGYVPTPRTFYDGITSIEPGHVVVFESGTRRSLRYWSPSSAARDPLTRASGRTARATTMERAAVEIRRLFEKAVERRLESDVPLGVFLSGGVDSSAVAAVTARLSGERIRTFTIGFDDTDGFDEREYATMVSDLYRTDHTEFVVAPRAADLVDELVRHHDGAFGDSSALPTYLLSQMTAEHVTVALCGDGGDEVFGGYERFAAALGIARLAVLPGALRSAVARVARSVPSRSGPGLPASRAAKVVRALSAAGETPDAAFLRWVSFVDAPTVARLCRGDGREAAQSYEEAWASSTPGGVLRRLQELTMRTYLLDDLLVKVDRMSMAHSLEVRSPFLDRELVEYALALPAHLKVRGTALKRVFKHAVADLLPEPILQRPKHGFGLPLDRWFRGELRDVAQQRLQASGSAIAGHLDPGAVRCLVEEHMSGARDRGHALWTLLTLEVFLAGEGW